MGKLWEPGDRYQSRRQAYRQTKGWAFPSMRERRVINWKKILWQSCASLLIFFMIWGVFLVRSPAVQPVQGKIRDWFTRDYDIQPVLKLFSDLGVWGDTIEKAAFETIKTPDDPGPLTVPVSGQITGTFGASDGIIITAAEGTPVRAALTGTVTRLANEEEKGRLVDITGDNGYITTYAYCKEILVNLNDRITAGQVIAKVGKSGKASHPQLYFRIMHNGRALDPTQYLLSTEKT